MKEQVEKRGAVDEPTLLRDRLQDLDTEVGKVIEAIVKGAATISKHLPFHIGSTQNLNPFGEKQAELDVFANNLFSDLFLSSGVVGQVASEEMEKPRTSGVGANALSIGMDPIDGSSNISTNNTLGSIFGIWRGPIPQMGSEQVASAFVTYGPTLSVTFTDGKTVEQYVEAHEGEHAGQFVKSYGSIKLPSKGEVYGFGGNRSAWVSGVERFVSKLERRGLKLRYGGTFIGDYNQILQKGGIFSYPELKDKPEGKFRMNYEISPISFISRVAGGYSSNGKGPVLEVQPESLAQTSPFYTGNADLVKELEVELASSV